MDSQITTDDTKHGDEKVPNTLEKRTRPLSEAVVEKAYREIELEIQGMT